MSSPMINPETNPEANANDINTVDGEIIQSGKFKGFKLIAQSALGVKSPSINVYSTNGRRRVIGVIHKNDIGLFKDGDGRVMQPIGGWQDEFSVELKEKLGLKAIDWRKLKSLDSDAQIQSLGVAMIDEIGNENIYVIKDGAPFAFKGNTNKYTVGEYDFTHEIVFDDGTGESIVTEQYLNNRMIAIREAMNELGWISSAGGLGYGLSMTKSNFIARFDLSSTINPQRKTGVPIKINPIGQTFIETIEDDLTQLPEQLAQKIDEFIVSHDNDNNEDNSLLLH